eukprot:scaffold83841_cov69-Phaeocystis_antarctica.AAC.3
MAPAPSPPQALAELPTGAPPNVLVVGAAGVGKSALIGAMSSQAEQHGLVLAAAEGLPSGRALEAYAKVARTPSLASPHPDVLRGRARAHAAALPALAGAARRDRVGGVAHPAAWCIRAAIRGADASRRGQPVAVRGGGVQQDGRRPLSDTAAGWCARRPPRAPHAAPRAPHAPCASRSSRACCWYHRAWRCAAVHRRECGARHEPASPLWAVGAEPEQATLADCEHGRSAREQHRVVVARRLRGPEEGLVWLGAARIWTAKVVDYSLCRLWLVNCCAVSLFCVRVGGGPRRRPLRAGDCVWRVGAHLSLKCIVRLPIAL